jgi:uncharacterized protein (DUF1501 family)
MNENKNTGRPISRRRFLGEASCSAVSSIPLLNTILNLNLAGKIAAAEPASNEYRALICLFLEGGCDSFNVLVPRGASEYAEYLAARDNLALAQNTLLPINPTNNVGRQLGLHPAVPELQSLFENGKAAFIANVGTLVQPATTRAMYDASLNMPLGLFSHSDQQEQWQTSTPDQRSAIGWAGRAADLLAQLNSIQSVSMNITLSGQNIWQSGQNIFSYSIDQTGAQSLNGYNPQFVNDGSVEQFRSGAVDGQLSQIYSNVFEQAFMKSKKDAMDAYQIFTSATAPALPGNVVFPGSDIGAQLQMIAKAIAGRSALGATRQTFFVVYGGWDHHSNVLGGEQAMLPEISQAVNAFYMQMVALGISNQVTLFTASDFGRTLTSNGNGSDHAWGGNQFVVGGGVHGKQIYGQYPSLALDGTLDVGRGRLIPTTSVDQYFAELAIWLGVSRASLPLVLPNIGRFFNTSGTSWPLGFLS